MDGQQGPRKRFIFRTLCVLLILFAIIGFYLIYLQIQYSIYKKYDDSEVRSKYSEILDNFNETERYHFTYQTGSMRGSLKIDAYYIKDKLFLKERINDGRQNLEISIPGRVGMGLSRELNYRGECELSYQGNWPRKVSSPCVLETGFSSAGEPVPVNIKLDKAQTPVFGKKTYLDKKVINGEKIFCFNAKTTEPLIKYSTMRFLFRKFPRLGLKIYGLLSKLPPRIENIAHLCYTEKGVLVQTSRGEKFVSINYEFGDSIFENIPYYGDFKKFKEKSSAQREEYYKFVIGEHTVYFKDFDNYLDFGLFEGQNYFSSGCSNGLFIGYDTVCNLKNAPPYSWMNLSFYPIKFLESRTIAGQTSDCFSYYFPGKLANIEKVYCIIDGGYVVFEKELREYNEGTGPSETSYMVSEISPISESEYLNWLRQAHY